MTTTTTLLTAADARRLTSEIRSALALADGLLVRLWEGEGWLSLNYPTFSAYCAAELPELAAIKLRAPARRARVDLMAAAGASIGDIVAATGAGRGTVFADLHRPDAAARPETVRSSDGRIRQSAGGTPTDTPRNSPPVPIVAQLVALLGERGPLSCAEIKRVTKRDHGSVSAALHRLATAGRVTYTPPPLRGQHGTYAATLTPATAPAWTASAEPVYPGARRAPSSTPRPTVEGARA